MKVRVPHTIRLEPRQQAAIMAFNKEVRHNVIFQPIDRARVSAIGEMGGQTVKDLASAFWALYPHWFTNGRRELAMGTIKQCREVCLDVVWKLNASSAGKFVDIIRLFDISGDNALATGRRPLARNDDYDNRYPRTRIRTRSTQCKYHPDKKTVSREYCMQCYARINTLSKVDIWVELLSDPARKEILTAPRPTRKKPLYEVAREVIKKYERLEEAHADSTA